MRRAFVGAVIMVILAACGGGSEQAETVAPESVAPFGSLATDALLRPVLNQEETAAAELAHIDREEALRACMDRAGWDYTPRPFDRAQIGADNPIDANLDYSSQRDWVAENGYGLATSLADDDRDAYLERFHGSSVDPALLELDDAQLEAYYAAQDECRTTAPSVSAEDDPLVDPAVEAAVADILSDERWIEAEAAWGPCMAESGFDVGSKDEAVGLVIDELESWAVGGADIDLDELRSFEISLARADLECWWTRVLPVQRAIEAEVSATLDP